MSNKRKKSSKSRAKNTSVNANNSAKTKRYMIILICILVGIALAVGATLGIISAVKNARAFMYIDGIAIDRGVASYLSSYYKAIYVASLRKELAADGIELYDTPEFWNSYANSKNTYGYYLSEFVKSLVSQTVAANKLFDDYTKLSDSDKEAIERSCSEILELRAGGSKSEFNSQVSAYGFDYSDFRKATEMLYKSWAARVKIFGENGEGMDNFPDYIENYYGRYSRAVLLVVRTEKVIETDENGNELYDEDRMYLMRPLTDEERAERQKRLSEIRSAAEGINSGEVAPERFFELWELYDEGIHENDSGSYYFMGESSYTKNFTYPDILNVVNDIEEGECAEVSLDIGVCFVYKLDREESGYSFSTNKVFFEDFYSLASGELYSELIINYNERVEIRDKWGELNISEIPYNTDYVAEF